MDNSSSNCNWELLPGIGLGKVRFLMSPQQVAAFDDVLGDVSSVHKPADMKRHALDTFNLLKDFITEADMKTVMDAIEETNANDPRGAILMEHRTTGLTLEYEDEQLTEVFADDRARQLHFKQIPVYSSSPINLVKKMAEDLNENPMAKDDELVFPQNNIYLFSFLRKDFTEGDAKNRTIMWRVKPRILGVDLSDYTTLELI